MSGPLPDKKADVPILHLLPNLLTITAICAGLTAIRFGYEGNYEMAVRLVLVACVLDGLDGRLARMMNCPSPIGAELDSLADFVNFGVAPVLILHSWSLQDLPSVGWIAVLLYAICCVLRLARFNVSSRQATGKSASDYFVGIPSPAGAVLVMLPMVVSFTVSDTPLVPPMVIAGHICLIGLLMISRIPTPSFKNVSVDRKKTSYFLLGTVLLGSALLTYMWATLTLLTLSYILCLAWAFRSSRKHKKSES